MSVFVDTGVLFAAAYARDRRHRDAVALLRKLKGTRLLTTDHVIIEVWALLRSRAGWDAAMRFWSALRDTDLRIEFVAHVDLERAEAIATLWADAALDIVDCTSFAVMERLRCHRAASFDANFAMYRYGAQRQKAFEILR